jgi:hypothetical protein
MKESKKINVLSVMIIVMAFIVVVELVVILRSIFDIKSENGSLKNEMSKIMDANKKLNEKNIELEKIIKQFCEPVIIPPDIPDGWSVYRHPSMGFEAGYPKGCKVEIGDMSGSKEQVMSIIANDSNTRVDIYAGDLNTYWNVGNYIIKKYERRLYVKETLPINGQNYEVYKLTGDKEYHVLLKGRRHVFDIVSKSEDFLIRIISTFKFI